MKRKEMGMSKCSSAPAGTLPSLGWLTCSYQLPRQSPVLSEPVELESYCVWAPTLTATCLRLRLQAPTLQAPTLHAPGDSADALKHKEQPRLRALHAGPSQAPGSGPGGKGLLRSGSTISPGNLARTAAIFWGHRTRRGDGSTKTGDQPALASIFRKQAGWPGGRTVGSQWSVLSAEPGTRQILHRSSAPSLQWRQNTYTVALSLAPILNSTCQGLRDVLSQRWHLGHVWESLVGLGFIHLSNPFVHMS